MLVACVVACGGGDATGPVAAPPVTLLFALQQVNGQNVPATFPMTDGTLVISSGTMKLTPEKTFSESVFYTFAPTGSAAVPDTALTVGTYSQTGADILFTIPPSPSAPGSTFTGTVTGNTLRYSDGGFVAVYGR